MKKIVSLMLITIMIFSSLVVAKAESTPSISACECGGHMVWEDTTHGKWYNSVRAECMHGNIDHNTIKQKRILIDTYICSSCNLGNDIVVEEYRIRCGSEVVNQAILFNIKYIASYQFDIEIDPLLMSF